MSDRDIVERVAHLLGDQKIYKVGNRNSNWRRLFSMAVYGEEALEWMLLLRPHMGERRQSQIDAVETKWIGFNSGRRQRHRAAKLTPMDVKEIRRLYAFGIPSQRMLGKMFRIGHGSVANVLKRRTWAHVD
jgi:hypothetical protein